MSKKIRKEIVKPGIFGPKPTENAHCTVVFTNIQPENGFQSEYISGNERIVVIGEANTAIDRQIDNLLLSMNKQEIGRVVIELKDVFISFDIQLMDFESKGYYYQWSAEEKCEIAKRHKQSGIDLFKQSRYIDASHRFSRGLKLLLSIPIPIDDVPIQIDSVLITDLENQRVNLYNNLAACYSKEDVHDIVIKLCTKVLQRDGNNCKALYKRGFAYSGNRDFERAKIDLEKVLTIDANNTSVKDKLSYVNVNINEQEKNCNSMVKKMFGN